MAKGKAIEKGVKLTPFNSKVKPETKRLFDAIVKVKAMEGNRSLLEEMLEMYEREHPDVVAAAKKYIKATDSLIIK